MPRNAFAALDRSIDDAPRSRTFLALAATPVIIIRWHRAVGRARRPGVRHPSLTAVIAAAAFAVAAFAFQPFALAVDPGQGGGQFEIGGYQNTGSGDQHWVGTWATSPQATNAITFNNQTRRMIVHTSIGGDTVRVRFSNA